MISKFAFRGSSSHITNVMCMSAVAGSLSAVGTDVR